ncbi:unnamed protein product [Sympodiomycopsis kandeliae]
MASATTSSSTMASTSVLPSDVSAQNGSNDIATSSTSAADQITEEEAALYDRQIRLWGSEAQSKMRQARVLITPFQGGLAIETAKNLILAGVKEIMLLDDGAVNEYSLAAGFVWREEDVGKKRVEAAYDRLASLNPHVKITPIAQAPDLSNILSELNKDSQGGSPLSSLVYTNSNPFAPSSLPVSDLELLSSSCRSLGIRFHLSSSQGLNGYIFQDLGEKHSFLVEKVITQRDSKNNLVEKKWNELSTSSFVTLSDSIQDISKSWQKSKSKSTNRRKLRNSQSLWANFALWSLLAQKEDYKGPEDILPSTILAAMTTELEKHNLDLTTLFSASDCDADEWIQEYLLNTIPAHTDQPADFAPTTAVLGGILSQEILNAIGNRGQPKVENWMLWDGLAGQGAVFRVGID